MSTIIEIRRADRNGSVPAVDELVLSDGRTLKVWNYQAATALDLNEADGDVVVGASLVDESKDDNGNMVYRFYSAKTMYVMSSVERRYPRDVDHVKELLALGWTTDLDEEVDMAGYTPGEPRGPGATQCAGGFRWYPPVEPKGKVTVKGTDDDPMDCMLERQFEYERGESPREEAGESDPGEFYPEPYMDDYEPHGPVFVSLDVESVPSHYQSDGHDEENRDD